jgi:hypothetical protein
VIGTVETTTNSSRPLTLNRSGLLRRLGVELYDGQREVYLSRSRIRAVSGGRLWGKSALATIEVVASAMQPAPRSLIWLLVPGHEHADVAFGRVLALLHARLSHRIARVAFRTRAIELVNLSAGRSRIEVRPTNHSALLADAVDFVCLDDAVDIRHDSWERSRALLVADHARALVLSRPRGTASWFAALCEESQRPESDVTAWFRASWENPHVPAAYVERERRRLPEVVFQGDVGGELVSELGVHCPVCRWPEAFTAAPVVLVGDQTLARCAACNRPVDKDGRVVSGLDERGELTAQVVRIQLPTDHPVDRPG